MAIIIDMRTRRRWKRKARPEGPAVSAFGEVGGGRNGDGAAYGIERRLGDWENIGLVSDRVVRRIDVR